ncbi:hypothetical protein [Kitasatospora sp. DSM 101779]|uniref:hypothetical protein n=1 Tax=Kitasatospora sp. DSM 101779 TaxID=2853165 RepID=UPI0021DB194C|nr:hypothetical protein [Kitasatospora sp. DSM 101779]MCU7822336.1 hypothetical protein [Kitasatospora sp. DSM 101779]
MVHERAATLPAAPHHHRRGPLPPGRPAGRTAGRPPAVALRDAFLAAVGRLPERAAVRAAASLLDWRLPTG